jgi:spoIIIJ-associated protein
MEKESLERSAKTVDEAIELALLEFGANRDEVEVDVLSKGRTGILGIGSEQARVRVTRIALDKSGAGAGLNTVNRILRGMGVEARPTIVSSGSGPDDPAVVNIEGEDAGLLIGRRGETLQALQFVVNLLLARQEDLKTTVIVDVERYRERRRQNLANLAKRLADRAAASGQPITLEPMSAADRRTIHVTLTDDGRVTTESTGEGRDRRVTIMPVQGGQRKG